jgi:AraC-like DNA-binding protein/mannose-6-phosphate isomerase-like protein (cupin superfamily)
MRNPNYIERKIFDNSGFPLEVLRMRSQAPTPGFHYHEFHELVIIIRGMGVHYTEVENYNISEGDVFLIRPGLGHGYADTKNLELVNILYIPERLGLPDFDLASQPGYQALFELEPRLRRQHKFKGRLNLGSDELYEAERIVKRIENEFREQKPVYRYMCVSFFMRLKGFLARCYTGRTSEYSGLLIRLGELISYIDRNYNSQLSLEDLCNKANMSPSTLNRTFHKAFGDSPVDYLIKKRISKACGYLTKSNKTITEIAVDCGFYDSNYFTRKFKKMKGMSPREYRKRSG